MCMHVCVARWIKKTDPARKSKLELRWSESVGWSVVP